MATAAVQLPTDILSTPKVYSDNDQSPKKHDVHTTLYYYKDPGDGSPPAPTYVGYSCSPLSVVLIADFYIN